MRTGRTLRRLALAAGGAAALLVSGCTGGGLNSVDVSSASSFAVDRGTALGSINAFRASNGLSPVAFDAVLDKAAERQARAMAARGKMSHSLDGSLPGRVSAYGYNWAAISENLGWNYGSVPAVIRGWEASPGHRRNLLNPNVTEIGLAAARGRSGEPYWALILGREKRR
ncbi:hypothetical protein ASG48_01410 [Aurantimonas sp. Leaf443]|nr:hypothetical protein ASG48_01410 [Aurantimonas sp. Leaf443]